MADGYATYSVHCDTLIKLSKLLTNYVSVMTPWIMLAVHQHWPLDGKLFMKGLTSLLKQY